MFVSVRDYILAELTLPVEWRVIEEQRIPAVIDKETVIIKHDRIEPLTEAPLSHLQNDVVLAVFIPNKDLAKAEDRMDQAVLALIEVIDAHELIRWSSAQKVVTPDGQYPGWEISLTVPTKK